MAHEFFSIKIEDENTADLIPDLLGLEVEMDDELAAQFRLRLAIDHEPDGTWRYLDDERLRVWRRVVISAGFEAEMEALIDGYITHVRPAFDPDPAHCTLEIWGMDRSVLLDREEKLQDWPNKKDSDIASEIFDAYALNWEVQDTEVVHDEAVSTIIQRETDMQFLLRLAARNGFECYVEGATGHFRSPQLAAPSQPVLAVHFGPNETNVDRFSIEVNALAPTDVAMWQIDRMDKTVLDLSVTESQQPTLGQTDATDLLPPDIDTGLTVVGQTVTTGGPEMAALCQGLYHQAEWFVTGEGEINANRYGHVLRPRKTVTIKGIGTSYSGVYYLAHVTHRFTQDGYTQHFRVRRNALLPHGVENFAASEEA